MTSHGFWIASALLLFVAAAPALAHHGTASVGAFGAEGPGAALDTTSPLPLGAGGLVTLAKSEYVPFQQRAGFDEQKQFSSFNTLALGYGVTPWLSAFVFQPFNWKSQAGVGTNSGLGDTNLMLAASFKWDEGLKLTPERESLDELEDWHFGFWAACTLPLGATGNLDDAGAFYAPDMQTGFRGPSPSVGLAVMKQLSDFTVLGEANYQHFFTQEYAEAGYRYRFGAETRLNAALVWKAFSSGALRVDLAPELSALNLQRDRSEAETAALEPMQASGGTIVYGQLGARATVGPLSLALGLKRALASRLNEGEDQQGSEGLESFRVGLTLGYSTRL